MRVLAGLLVFAAACGSEEGAVLAFEGPEDIAADRIEVVLASGVRVRVPLQFEDAALVRVLNLLEVQS